MIFCLKGPKALRVLLVFVLAFVVLHLHEVPVAHAATITVTTAADELNNDGDCSLREAIQAANTDTAVDACPAGSGDDIITLPAGTYTLTLSGVGEDGNTTGDLDITDNLTINGAGAASTVIDGGGIDRVLHILGISVTINGVTITNGYSSGGGGGIYNHAGTLTLNRSVVSGNSAGDAGGGGGIYNNQGTVTLNSTTVSGNTADYGGGIYSYRYYTSIGVLTLNYSTVSGNWASKGGGISNNKGTVTLNNSTISSNTANVDGGGGIYTLYGTVTLNHADITFNDTDLGNGGGINNAASTVTIQNTIIAGNYDTGGEAPDCSGTLTSQDYNLIQDITGCTVAGTTTHNITGQAALLVTLADNGGPTFTHALQSTSPAIDQIPNGSNSCAAGSSIDQRGAVRADGAGRGGSGCDMGPYEFDSIILPCPDFVYPMGVGLEDVQTVAGHWGEQSTDPGWNPQYDLDGNQLINILDIMKVAMAVSSICP